MVAIVHVSDGVPAPMGVRLVLLSEQSFRDEWRKWTDGGCDTAHTEPLHFKLVQWCMQVTMGNRPEQMKYDIWPLLVISNSGILLWRATREGWSLETFLTALFQYFAQQNIEYPTYN